MNPRDALLARQRKEQEALAEVARLMKEADSHAFVAMPVSGRWYVDKNGVVPSVSAPRRK